MRFLSLLRNRIYRYITSHQSVFRYLVSNKSIMLISRHNCVMLPLPNAIQKCTQHVGSTYTKLHGRGLNNTINILSGSLIHFEGARTSQFRPSNCVHVGSNTNIEVTPTISEKHTSKRCRLFFAVLGRFLSMSKPYIKQKQIQWRRQEVTHTK